MNIVYFHGRYKTSENSHEFSLNRYDIYRMDLNYCSNMGFFNVAIYNNSSAFRRYLRCPKGVVKALKILV